MLSKAEKGSDFNTGRKLLANFYEKGRVIDLERQAAIAICNIKGKSLSGLAML